MQCRLAAPRGVLANPIRTAEATVASPFSLRQLQQVQPSARPAGRPGAGGTPSRLRSVYAGEIQDEWVALGHCHRAHQARPSAAERASRAHAPDIEERTTKIARPGLP